MACFGVVLVSTAAVRLYPDSISHDYRTLRMVPFLAARSGGSEHRSRRGLVGDSFVADTLAGDSLMRDSFVGDSLGEITS